MSKKSEFREQFDAKLAEMFPDVFSDGLVSRRQIDEVRDALGTKSYPVWHMENRVARGMYAIAGGKSNTSNAVLKEEPVACLSTTGSSLFPTITAFAIKGILLLFLVHHV